MKEIVNQLSSREKKLLYILLCFLIVIGGWFFVVLPSLNSYKNVCAEYEAAFATKDSKDKELQNYLNAPDLLKQKKESYTKIINKYNKTMSNEKIDKLLTTAFLSQGLRPTSLSISGVQATTLNSSDKTKKDTTTDATTDTNAATTNLTQATVSVSVKGSFAQITNTIAYLNKMKGVEVSSLTYSEGSGIALGSQSDTTSFSIIVYMINDIYAK